MIFDPLCVMGAPELCRATTHANKACLGCTLNALHGSSYPWPPFHMFLG